MLAGGRSTRFGRDKLAEPYRGVPLLHHPIRRLAEVCSEVLVAIAADTDVPAMPEGIPVRMVRDEEPFGGPLAGLGAGLAATRTELVLVAAGDMPELQARVLLAMLARAEEPSVRAVALEEDGTLRPLPCVLRSEPALAASRDVDDRGGSSLRELLEALQVSTVEQTAWLPLDPERNTLTDVDVPEDLEVRPGSRRGTPG